MSDDQIEVVEVVETDFGEKVIIDSPYDAKGYIKHLPWKEYSEEIADHGSLKKKAESRGTNTKSSELFDVFEAVESFDFSDDFATHVSWEPDALGGEGAWSIDKEAVTEAADFWEYAGFSVSITADL